MENMISQKAVAVINTIRKATEKSVTGVSFVSIRNYANKSGEVSNNLLNVGASYEKAKQKDIDFLTNLNVSEYEFKSEEISSGVFLSPTYPGTYPNKLNCTYRFIGQTDERLSIYFEEILLHYGADQ